jgi:serine/threonine-protein kinase RsbW
LIIILGLEVRERKAYSARRIMHPHPKNHPFRPDAVHLAGERDARQIRVHSPGELRPFFKMLEVWMKLLRYPRKDIFAVSLALREAASNAFRHGNRRDSSKSIDVRYLVTAAEILLEVEDQGSGFDPEQVPDPLAEPYRDRPSGRGLFLMRTYMTWVSFNREGNRVTFSRQRSNS